MAPISVARVTIGAASADRLSECEYREIYLELAQGKTTRQVAQLLGAYSNAWWAEFGKGHKRLTAVAKAALRRTVGLPALPQSVAAAMAGVSPDAEVLEVGQSGQADGLAQWADRVIVTDRAHSLLLRLEGTECLWARPKGRVGTLRVLHAVVAAGPAG